MKTLPILGFAAALAMAGTAFAQSQPTPPAANKKMSASDCTSLWSSLDAGKTGSVTEAQAKTAVPNFKTADSNHDGKLSQSEFMTACGNGSVTGSGSRGMTGTDTPTTPPAKTPATPSK